MGDTDADLEAIKFMTGQAELDTAGATADKITEMQGAFNLNIGPITGSHATIAARLDEVAEIPGVKGVMCVFDDYPTATAEFGAKVMPLMKSRG
jgi:pyrimidine oxygenase